MADGSRGAGVPSANRGLKVGSAAFVDYLTFSAPVSCVVALPGVAFAESAFAQFYGGTSLRLDGQCRGMRNFYETHWRIVTPEGQVCGFVAVGGNGGTFCIDLTGAGCAYVNDWGALADRLDACAAHISRADAAHDDFRGTHPVRWAERAYDAGEFVRGGRPPAAEFYDDKASNKGCTLYVGRNTGNQTLCVYEKGKQLGDATSPWVRYEGRFGNKYRAVPTDVLRRPGEFLAGMWSVLGWISEIADRFATAAKKAVVSARSLAFHLKRQYGKFLYIAKNILSDEREWAAFVASVSRPGLPEKLKLPLIDKVLGAEHFRGELCVSW